MYNLFFVRGFNATTTLKSQPLYCYYPLNVRASIFWSPQHPICKYHNLQVVTWQPPSYEHQWHAPRPSGLESDIILVVFRVPAPNTSLPRQEWQMTFESFSSHPKKHLFYSWALICIFVQISDKVVIKNVTTCVFLLVFECTEFFYEVIWAINVVKLCLL